MEGRLEKIEKLIESLYKFVRDEMVLKSDLLLTEERINIHIDNVEQNVNDRIDKVEERLDGRLDRIDARLENVENKLDTTIEKQNIIIGQIVGHEARITRPEAIQKSA